MSGSEKTSLSALFRKGAGNFIEAFNDVSQIGYEAFRPHLENRPVVTSMLMVALCKALLDLPPEDAVGIISAGIILAGSRLRSNKHINAAGLPGAGLMTAHMAMVGNLPGVVQNGIGAVRVGTMVALNGDARWTKTAVSAACVAAAAGCYLGFKDQASLYDYIPLAGIGLTAVGGALPVSLSRYSRVLFTVSTASYAGYFGFDDHPSISAAVLNGVLTTQYARSMMRFDMGDFSKDLQKLVGSGPANDQV